MTGQSSKKSHKSVLSSPEKVELNNDLKDELEDTISGLTDYMQQAQRKAAEQDRKNQTLLKERDQLLRRLCQLEEEQGGRRDGSDLMHDFEDLEEMQRVRCSWMSKTQM